MGNIIKKNDNIENTQIIKEYIEYNKKNRFSNINEDIQGLQCIEDLEAIDDVKINHIKKK